MFKNDEEFLIYLQKCLQQMLEVQTLFKTSKSIIGVEKEQE